MADKHVVRFEPVGIEIEVDEEQTVLRAAAEQGIMLMHGCKEGQCAACKSFVLDGDDIELDQLLDLRAARLREGGGLHAPVPGARLRGRDDRAAQLRRGDDPLRPADPEGRTPRWSPTSSSRHDMRHLVLRLVEPTELTFFPGQYVDLTVPGTETTRSFSMANTSSQGERPARVRHPGLPRRRVLPASWTAGWPSATGSTSSARSGSFTLREGRDVRPGVRRRRRRDGADPVHPAHRSPSKGSTRKATFYYGARRRRDLCFEKELAELEAHLPDFRYVPALSEPDEEAWDGRGRVHHRRRCGATRRTSPTSTPTSAGRRRWSRRPWRCSATSGASEKRIYYDKFTTTAPS